MFDNSIVKRTGQMWKLYLSFILLLLGSASIFGSIISAKTTSYSLMAILIFGGLIVSLSSLIFVIVSVRCPNCKAPWFWQGISGKSPGSWLLWLMSQTECPKCKH